MRYSCIASIVAALLCACGFICSIHAEVVTFVELADVPLFPASSRDSDSVNALHSQHHVPAAILKTREWVLSGKQLDFAVILGLGTDGFQWDGIDPVDQQRIAIRVKDHIAALRALPVKVLAILPGPKDIDAGTASGTTQFRAFVALMRAELPDKKVINLCEDTTSIHNFEIVGLNSAGFSEPASGRTFTQQEIALATDDVRRLASSVQDKKSFILFSYFFDLDAADSTHAAWNVPESVRAAVNPVIHRPELMGVFGAPYISVDWSIYQSPHHWRSNDRNQGKAQAWMTPPVTATSGGTTGISFVSLSDSGEVKVTQQPLSYPMPDESFQEHAIKLREGDAFFAIGDYERAITAYTTALGSKQNSISAAAAQKLDTLLLKKSDDEYRHKLSEGEAYFAAENYDGAITAYKEAVASRKALDNSTARAKLNDALVEKKKETIGFLWFIPKWIRDYKFPLIALLALLVYFWGKGFVRMLLCRKPFRSSWQIRFLTASTAQLPTELFLHEFMKGVADIGRLSNVFDGKSYTQRIPGRGMDRFAFPLDLENVLKPEELSLGGIDFGVVARASRSVLTHYSWKLEIQLHRAAATTSAYAWLRWGPTIEETWQVPTTDDLTPRSVGEAGRLLAYAVFSNGWVRQ